MFSIVAKSGLDLVSFGADKNILGGVRAQQLPSRWEEDKPGETEERVGVYVA